MYIFACWPTSTTLVHLLKHQAAVQVHGLVSGHWTDVEAETPMLWPPDANSWIMWKDPDAGKDWGQEEKGMTEDEMVGWHHRLTGDEFEWTPGVGNGQGGLACCGSWSRKELDTTERLNWTECDKKGILGYFPGGVRDGKMGDRGTG